MPNDSPVVRNLLARGVGRARRERGRGARGEREARAPRRDERVLNSQVIAAVRWKRHARQHGTQDAEHGARGRGHGDEDACLPYACEASHSITPPKDGNDLRIVTAMFDRVLMSWYPPPAAVLEAGAPTKTLTLGLGLSVRAQSSLSDASGQMRCNIW